jgi:hypothetical protein
MTSAPPAIKMYEPTVHVFFELPTSPKLGTGSAMGWLYWPISLFDKLLTIHNKHGPFDFALCMGDFWGHYQVVVILAT